MDRAINDLIDILKKQIANYRDLKDMILEKRKAVMGNNLLDLSNVTSRIEILIASNNELEIGRLSLVKKMIESLPLGGSNPTLANIARCFDGPISERLMSLRRQAREVIGEVQRQNCINAEMLKYSAGLMDSVLRKLVDGESDGLTYTARGKTKSRSASVSLLDQQI